MKIKYNAHAVTLKGIAIKWDSMRVVTAIPALIESLFYYYGNRDLEGYLYKL